MTDDAERDADIQRPIFPKVRSVVVCRMGPNGLGRMTRRGMRSDPSGLTEAERREEIQRPTGKMDEQE